MRRSRNSLTVKLSTSQGYPPIVGGAIYTPVGGDTPYIMVAARVVDRQTKYMLVNLTTGARYTDYDAHGAPYGSIPWTMLPNGAEIKITTRTED